MSRIILPLILCIILINAQDTTAIITTDKNVSESAVDSSLISNDNVMPDSTRRIQILDRVLQPNTAADSLVVLSNKASLDSLLMNWKAGMGNVLFGGKQFVVENRKELGIYAGFGVFIYIISEIIEPHKTNPQIGDPPDWPQ